MTPRKTSDILRKYQAPIPGWELVFEDDGRTGYAYLLSDDGISADVWLYNRGAPPLTEPWSSGPDGAPFENPQEYAGDLDTEPPVDGTEIAVSWGQDPKDGVAAIVKLRGVPMGFLRPDCKPGWARLAKKEGPLARVMDTTMVRRLTSTANS